MYLNNKHIADIRKQIDSEKFAWHLQVTDDKGDSLSWKFNAEPKNNDWEINVLDGRGDKHSKVVNSINIVDALIEAIEMMLAQAKGYVRFIDV